MAQRRAGGADNSGKGPSVYSIRIRLLKHTIGVDGAEVPLTPGMAVTAEVKIGRRRVIGYLSDPILRYQAESLRER
jgi:hemolysin D